KLNLLHCIVTDLESIHSQEMIHRDLNSGNILQDTLESAYITDLGLSISTNEKMNGKMEGKICGILPYIDINQGKSSLYGVMPYIAPEVLNGQKFTIVADIYGLGIIMWEISTGQRPFDGV
ncbi:kinase-like domain-containing protein, partial [Gigaspora rosea]